MKTHEFLKHALVECSFGLSTPVVLLYTGCKPSARTPTMARTSYLVVSFQAIPVLVKLLETVLPHLSNPNGFVQQTSRDRDLLTKRTSLEHTG